MDKSLMTESILDEYLTIGEVSKLTGIPISTLRYYDSEGIISPSYKDKKNNYRYYTEMQVPVLRIIVHLKKIGFSNESIKSHLRTLNYSHTLELITQIIADTKAEIKRLQKTERELIKNAVQMEKLISIERKINTFFIEEIEETKGVYIPISTNDEPRKVIKAAFRKLDVYTSKERAHTALLPIGIYALMIPEESIKNGIYRETKLFFMSDIKGYKDKMIIPKTKYACMYCKGRLLDKQEKIEELLRWIKDKGMILDKGDTLFHFMAGPGFVKEPTELLYTIKIPVK